IVDLKGLMGDASDNLPGIPGVGEKTAIKLLKEYGTVEELLKNTDQLKGKMKEKIETHQDQARLCKQMATIHVDVPVELTFDEISYDEPNFDDLIPFYKEMEFNGLIKKIKMNENKPLVEKAPITIISEVAELEHLKFENCALHVELFEENYHHAQILGIGLVMPSQQLYIPFDVVKQSKETIAFLENEQIKKDVFDLKRSMVALKWQGIALRGVEFDLLLATYVLNPTHVSTDFKKVAMIYDYEAVSYDEEVYGKGAKRAVASVESVARHTVDIALAISLIKENCINQLKEAEQFDLFEDMEMPLAIVLGEMEYQGMAVDLDELQKMGDDLKTRIEAIEKEIYQLADTTFNINSPKQLGEVLFERLSLPVVKKNKTGYSTNVDVLEKLMDTHPIIKHIMDYRTLTKLYTTYIEGLKKARFEDGKVHTIFNQALTQTGRLSSIEPNLQNIPIRLEEGRLIRKAFVPSEKGWVILGADYSQIELRILAHISNTESLIEAFRTGQDIHTKTAMDVFKVSQEEVTSDLRRSAKAINFGIIYGMSAFGLSENLKIGQKEAKGYIEHYLETYSGIKAYMDETIKYAKFNGYVSTLFNRRRYITELSSSNYAVRQFGERTAMNAPIQGAAADIIKKAMIDVYEKMQAANVKSRLLLQVHDELIFEVPQDEIELMTALVIKTMEEVVDLQVPLKVDYSQGASWYDAK
ncbi:MAG: DNA polymerase I, partial [Turicibacter sp.]